MDKKIVLSIDSKILNNPKLINLDDDCLNNNNLVVFTNTDKLRSFIKNSYDILEILIVSNDDIEAINLAAAIKKDREDAVVCLVTNSQTGSLNSRANAANIDVIINYDSLKERIEAIKVALNKPKNIDKLTINRIPNSNNNEKETFVLSVLSSTGGSGKSSVSCLLSVLLQAAGINTLLIDADFQFGDCDTLIGANDPVAIDKFITEDIGLNELKTNTSLPSLLSAPTKPELVESISEKLPILVQNLKANFDAIIINTGSYWNELQALLLESDSKAIFLIDQRPSSLNSTTKAINLCSRCGIATASINFLLNKCSKRALFSAIDISYALKGVAVNEILDGGLEVDESLSSGQPLNLIKSNNPFAVSLWTLVEKLLPNELKESILQDSKSKGLRPSVKNKQRGLFSRKRF